MNISYPMTMVNVLEFCKLIPQKTHKKTIFHLFFSSENSSWYSKSADLYLH